jgi:hypothetical protein
MQEQKRSENEGNKRLITKRKKEKERKKISIQVLKCRTAE